MNRILVLPFAVKSVPGTRYEMGSRGSGWYPERSGSAAGPGSRAGPFWGAGDAITLRARPLVGLLEGEGMLIVREERGRLRTYGPTTIGANGLVPIDVL